MLDLSHVFGDLFCIAILVTTIAGMISQRESEEKNAFLALIFTAMIYISLCLLEQFFASRILLPTLMSTRIMTVVSSIAAAELMHASLRYLYLVITGKTPRGLTFWIPVLSLLVLCVASIWTGWIFSIDASLQVTPGPLQWVEFVLVNCYPVISTIMAVYKWTTSRSAAIRLRCSISASFVVPLIVIGLMEQLNSELQLKSFGITLAVTMVFIRLQKQSVTESIQSLQIQRENATRYRNTLLSTALQFMVVDLTRDTILELSVPRNPEITVENLIRDGRLPSFRYSDTVEIWCKNTVGISEEEKDRLFSPKALLHRYNCGETQISDTLQIRLSNGKIAWCRQDLIMARNSQTKDVVATLTIYDITEQKLREQSLQTQQQIIEALASGVSAYWILDWNNEGILAHHTENDHIRYFSERIMAQGTYTNALNYIYGSLVDENMRNEALSFVRVDVIRQKLTDSDKYTVPLYLSAQGSFFQITFNRIYVGDRKAFIVAAREITEMVKRERGLRKELAVALSAAQTASQAKTDFLLNMSHDIRTPMNAILGFQELAKRNVHDPERVLDALEKSRRSGEHLLNLINDILDMSRIESGKMTLSPEIIDINEHISRFEDMFRFPMEERGLTLSFVNETHTPYVWGDYLRLTQVIANLLSNAMKFTPEGGSVTFHATESPARREGFTHFAIHIRDTGIGMSEEFQQRLFDAFEREHNTTVSGVQGTGLGLAISKKLTDLMGGTLVCSSSLGNGTEFVFSFELPVADAPTGRKDTTKADLSGRKILLVEDNELNREIACEILSGGSIQVTEVTNGAEAVECLRSSPPGTFDAVLMDIQMPVMDGYTATRMIRQMENPAIANLPIIAMTADAFAEDKRRALEAGFTAHIAKPVNMATLIETLSQYIPRNTP